MGYYPAGIWYCQDPTDGSDGRICVQTGTPGLSKTLRTPVFLALNMPDSDMPDSDMPDSDMPDSGIPDSGYPYLGYPYLGYPYLRIPVP